jgi:pimeloyl-ACP methyl ester carboxylesterase
VLIVHGWTGCKDRNIVPAMTRELERDCVVHRCTLSHAGIERDAQDITKPDEFERDRLAYCVEDVRRALARVMTPASGPPVVLIGHSRAGATIVRVCAESQRRGWGVTPDALVSLAGTATYTRFTDEMRDELREKGFVERDCPRAPGGVVRMGPSWYEHHTSDLERDLFAADCADVDRPVLIVHGDGDTSVPIDHAETTARLLRAGVCPGVEVVRVPGADHNLDAGGPGFDRDNVSTPATRRAGEAIRALIARL